MRYRFITVVHFLKLGKSNCIIPLLSGMLSNKSSLLKEILSYQSTLALGTMGVHSIDEFQGNTFYFVDGEFDASITQEKVGSFGTNLAFGLLRQIQSLTNGLWSIRDNSVYVRDGFLFVFDKEFEDGVSFKASLSTINTKASGLIEEVCFSKEEIERVSESMQVISMDDVSSGTNFRDATQFQYFKNAKMGRKAIAELYVFHARASASLSMKVLLYITAMEALISTSTAELSHQVAERVAVLLGNDASARIAIYNDIKKGYGYRSKTAHGEALKGTEQDVAGLLERLDDYLRQLLRFDVPFNLEPEQINLFFLNKLLN
ncbi:MAG: hypothetical protein IKM99_10180 [Bacteroidales bacterium]|nr:hypothetical protein [Bacteroidales bacterium]